MSDELVHKRTRAADDQHDARPLCGRYGFTTALWRNVTCVVCKKRRPRAAATKNRKRKVT